MSKISWRPGTQIYPLPAVLVTCGDKPENWNMLTVAWTGTICSDPAMCYVSVRPERASYPLIKENMEFTRYLLSGGEDVSYIHHLPEAQDYSYPSNLPIPSRRQPSAHQ